MVSFSIEYHLAAKTATSQISVKKKKKKHFSLRNVIWDHQVLTCFPVMTVIWRGVALSSTQCFIDSNTLLHGPFHESFPFTATVSSFPFRNWAIMNLTASSWFHNYFCEAMDNVIQDSKGKNVNIWESN